MGAAIYGRRLVLLRRDCDPPITQKSPARLTEILLKEGMLMLTLEGLIAVISLCLTAFGLGYTIGSNNKTQKQPPTAQETETAFLSFIFSGLTVYRQHPFYNHIITPPHICQRFFSDNLTSHFLASVTALHYHQMAPIILLSVVSDYSITVATRPDPTVRPPSRYFNPVLSHILYGFLSKIQ